MLMHVSERQLLTQSELTLGLVHVPSGRIFMIDLAAN